MNDLVKQYCIKKLINKPYRPYPDRIRSFFLDLDLKITNNKHIINPIKHPAETIFPSERKKEILATIWKVSNKLRLIIFGLALFKPTK